MARHGIPSGASVGVIRELVRVATVVAVVTGATVVTGALASNIARADPPRLHTRARAHLADAASVRAPLPQECAMDPFRADYGGLERGSRVRLGRHRVVDGSAFWTEGMDAYVGRVTTVTGARGVDEKGCPLVSVTADDGEFDWRIRDLELASSGAVDARVVLDLAPGFAGDPRTFEGVLSADQRFDAVGEGCPGIGGHSATMRLTLTADFTAISILAHADQDLVLMVRTPSGETICADDVDDLDPVITGSAARGTYEIWVGGYDSSVNGTRFRLGISEKLTVRAADLATLSVTTIEGDEVESDGEPVDAEGAGEPETPAVAPPMTRSRIARPAVGAGRR